MILKKLEQLRKLPDQKKQYIAFGGAACVSGLIFLFWVVSLSVTLHSSPAMVSSEKPVATASSVSPLEAMQANLGAAFVPVGEAFRGVVSYFSGSTTPATSTAQVSSVQPNVPVAASVNTSPTLTPSITPQGNVQLISHFLTPGDTGDDVTILQKVLTVQGFYAGPLNGKFGPATEAALAKFQKAHGIALTKADGAGLVGTKTKTLLNQLLQQ